MKTLLQKAKEVERRTRKKTISDEEIEVGIAWLKEEISMKQAAIACDWNYSGGMAMYNLSLILKEAYRRGKINA